MRAEWSKGTSERFDFDCGFQQFLHLFTWVTVAACDMCLLVTHNFSLSFHHVHEQKCHTSQVKYTRRRRERKDEKTIDNK